MALIEIETCKNWHDLRKLIDEYFTHYDDYIFRGQADHKWKLESSLTRSINVHYTKSTESEIRWIVGNHLRTFKSSIRGRSNLDLSQSSSDLIWSLGQHFGLYTPFLDWSRSPYVALFFSLFGPCKSGRRALWAICEAHIQEFWPEDSEGIGLRVVEPLSHDNQRLVSQNGLFLDVPVGKAADEIIMSQKDYNNEVTVFKIIFPDSIREDALLSLNNMNINHASLFPDINGSSFLSNFFLEIQPYLETKRPPATEDR